MLPKHLFKCPWWSGVIAINFINLLWKWLSLVCKTLRAMKLVFIKTKIHFCFFIIRANTSLCNFVFYCVWSPYQWRVFSCLSVPHQQTCTVVWGRRTQPLHRVVLNLSVVLSEAKFLILAKLCHLLCHNNHHFFIILPNVVSFPFFVSLRRL